MNKITDLLDNGGLKDVIFSAQYEKELFIEADKTRRAVYGTDVYLRGLIEFSNYCKNDCLYCGIRNSNKNLKRYRLSPEEIVSCCENGYKLGFRTFVLQSGEDSFFTDKIICGIVASIKEKFSDCAVTLSVGEKTKETYRSFFSAGADRYLLRHETANEEHYRKLHPQYMKLSERKQCLFDLKEIGFQVGAGFMVGSPYQTQENIIEDLIFLRKLNPDMIGIGPFINHADTPFASFPNGSLEVTLRLIAVLRLLFPFALIPATTALGTIAHNGRELGLKAGANVVMPNLSPTEIRKLYSLYDNKICTGDEAAECRRCIEHRIIKAGYNAAVSRGDSKLWTKSQNKNTTD
ncbi:MAG: [FeFe] hydrogenase H-cluster radical SAM maturase HydE [Clostridiales bacterium]|jgi:biotin synthase|nr:[FeFe] hydrogenase H-cluster radical SAM maturase HydE [Clostridiales bacterium]